MGEQPSHGRTHKAGIPCQLILPGMGAVREIAAEAVNLDRRGGVLYFVSSGVMPGLRTQMDVLVFFHLPRGRETEPRRLCFRAGVRHVSTALAPHHWIGVSFLEAAICGFGQCFPVSDRAPDCEDS